MVQECSDPTETVNSVTECPSEYVTKCETVTESVCHDETVPVCETKKMSATLRTRLRRKWWPGPSETPCTTRSAPTCPRLSATQSRCLWWTLQNCHTFEKTVVDHVTRQVCNIVTDQQCTKVPEQNCKIQRINVAGCLDGVPKEVYYTINVDECNCVPREVCVKQAQNNWPIFVVLVLNP